MANVTASMVKELREATGAGMMDCKKALVECDGVMDKAVEYLKEKGLSKAAKKASRIAAEGLVRVAAAADSKSAALVEVNSETDFVAKNEEFKDFVATLAQISLNADSVCRESLLEMAYGEEGTVQEVLTAKIAKIGENMNLRRAVKVSGDVVATYVHGGGRIGVAVAANGEESDAVKEALVNVAMQVAAMNPQYVSRDQIAAEELESIRNITIESSLNDPFNLPKPILNELLGRVSEIWSAEDVATLEEKRADKNFNFNYITNFLSEAAVSQLAALAVSEKASIAENKMFKGAVEGRVSKQLKEICLMDQTYVKAADGKQTVSQYLDTVSKNIKIAHVIRYEVGEGLEKKQENFAEEVAKQMK
ncbi:MAG: elongation factor Ts [Firmicutes bacterium]|nr:elongation factor Ts [Bacillota bacterium]